MSGGFVRGFFVGGFISGGVCPGGFVLEPIKRPTIRCSEIIQVQRFCKLQGLLFQNNTRNWNIVCTSVVERSVNCLVKVFIFCSFHLLSFWVNFSRFISSQNFIFFCKPS